MSRIQLGYGSEWHLLRMLGRHREAFSSQTLSVTAGSRVDWCDFRFTTSINKQNNFGDAELTGIEFLPTDHLARSAWKEWWPQTGNAHNWDAVGRLHYGDECEWLLVEAKANVEELNSSCGAKEVGGLSLIRQRLNETKAVVGASEQADWLQPYYQYANRLAFLHFLLSHGVPARLLFVYFTGDRNGDRTCPDSAAGWRSGLDMIKRHLGLKGCSDMEARVHELFVPVCGAEWVLERSDSRMSKH